MSIDFSYANDAAVEAIGVYDEYDKGTFPGHTGTHPAGWTKSVIDKIHQYIMGHKNGVDWTKFSQEEHDAYTWYSDEVIEQEHWKKLVAAYQKSPESTGDDVNYNKFDDSHEYDGLGGDITPPDVSTYNQGSDNSNGDLKVSTDAIRYFAKEIDKIAYKGGGLLIDASNAFNSVDVRPGKFAKAEVMRQKISGTGDGTDGLITDTQGLLLKLHETLYTLSENLVKMADSYEYTEDHNVRTGKDLTDKTKAFNDMTTTEFGKDMSDAWGNIGDLGDYGNNGDSNGSNGNSNSNSNGNSNGNGNGTK